MVVTIDRFEGDYAVCEMEDMTFANLPKAFLPAGAQEGSKLSINLDAASQAADEARIEGKMNQLFND
ncbi:DUF3006 domain-containing protein [Clostridiaceae bacterium HFYG-1003]|nr:DUF3006 domain-containing protein [Clostridiaceae bacterium HFYG-1003]